MWDHQDRLVNLSNETTDAQYRYDYTDRRVLKQTPQNSASNSSSQATLYIDKFSEIRNRKLIKYLYAGERRIARASTSSGSLELDPSTYYLHDHLGSSSLTLSTNAIVLEQRVHYPYGHLRKEDRTTPSLTDYTFTGKERDRESDLHYFEARYYAGYLGRFLSVDPLYSENLMPNSMGKNTFNGLRSSQKLNLYSYARNNPILYVDPNGKVAWVGAAIGGAVGFGAGFTVDLGMQVWEKGFTGVTWGDVGDSLGEGIKAGAVGAAVGATGGLSLLGQGAVVTTVSVASEVGVEGTKSKLRGGNFSDTVTTENVAVGIVGGVANTAAYRVAERVAKGVFAGTVLKQFSTPIVKLVVKNSIKGGANAAVKTPINSVGGAAIDL